MAIELKPDNITGAANISASGTAYGLTIDSNGYVQKPLTPLYIGSLEAYTNKTGNFSPALWGGDVNFTPYTQGGLIVNTATCTFTVPVAGMYVIQSHQRVNVTGEARMYARKNGVVYSQGWMNHDMCDLRVTLCTNCAANDTLSIDYHVTDNSGVPGGNMIQSWSGNHSSIYVHLIG